MTKNLSTTFQVYTLQYPSNELASIAIISHRISSVNFLTSREAVDLALQESIWIYTGFQALNEFRETNKLPKMPSMV